jgi:hypothetical protein
MPLLLTSVESWSHRVELFFGAVLSVRAEQGSLSTERRWTPGIACA